MATSAKETETISRFLGWVGVDSGSVVICDPCYADRAGGPDEWIEATSNEISGGPLANALGVISVTHMGDGVYPVFAEYESTKPNRPVGLYIDLTYSGSSMDDPDPTI